METMMQGLVIVGGLTFSLAASLLIEELIFGRIVRLAFARRAYFHRPRPVNTVTKRPVPAKMSQLSH